eukprot:GHUV01022871.1.p2 GENE.GHUV01022871.1~~GHUV01022871.1.p2  ORF type:complete len:152 (+),score=3.96 GHUV01022871.1:460-915(+)
MSAVLVIRRQQRNVKNGMAAHAGWQIQLVSNVTHSFDHCEGANVLGQQFVDTRHFQLDVTSAQHDFLTHFEREVGSMLVSVMFSTLPSCIEALLGVLHDISHRCDHLVDHREFSRPSWRVRQLGMFQIVHVERSSANGRVPGVVVSELSQR